MEAVSQVSCLPAASNERAPFDFEAPPPPRSRLTTSSAPA